MLKLYGYYRSSAAYRVRIALNYKKLDYDSISVHLVKEGGQQHQEDYLQLNPQALVPSLITEDGQTLTQSLAIIEYLEESYPQPALLPSNKLERARVRALAQAIACETHPLNNLRVLQYLENTLGHDKAEKVQWYAHWIHTTFAALEKQLQHAQTGLCCHGDSISIADLCLIPQVYNAERFNIALDNYPTIARINEHCLSLAYVANSIPEAQADAA